MTSASTIEKRFSHAHWSERIEIDASRRFLFVIAGAAVLLIAWAALFQVDKVTRGAGRVLPSVQNQLVQHLEGGIVSEILVSEGQRVKQGDVLMRLDNQFTRAELSNTTTDITAQRLMLVRLEAEIARATTLELPAELAAERPDIAASEQSLFASRRRQINQEIQTADDQARALRLQLSSLQDRQRNLETEEQLLARQLQSLERALKVEAVSENEVLDKRSSLQQLRTRKADVVNQIPQTRAELAEAQGRAREIWLRFVSENQEKIAEINRDLAKDEQALSAFEDRSSREDIRAPMDGVVNTVFVQTVGGVVKPGDSLVEIVPVDQSVMIEARVDPKDRGKIWPGLPATVKITAYDFAIYGGLEAEVVDISADALMNEDGSSYYRVRLEADTTRFGDDKPVIPGMMADVDIKSGKQTILSYILSPINNVRANAFRE